MGHNIAENIKNGGAAFVSGNNKPAWHGLGTVLDGQLTSQECLKYGGLDYQVGIRPAKVLLPNENGEDQLFDVPKTNITYREDNNVVLGSVGDRYTVVQNKNAFTFFDAIVGKGEAIYETAGALGEGERIFISAKMPDYININGTDDITEMFVLLTSSHDGTGAIKAMVTPIRVVCQNTLNFAMQGCTNKVSIRHTMNAETALANAHKLLGITNQYAQEMDEMFNHLNTVKVSDSAAKDVIAKLFPSDKDGDDIPTRTLNMREALYENYLTGVGQKGIVGTAYGLLQGTTYYTNHVRSYKDDDTKFKSIMEGQSEKLINQALGLVMQLA